MAKEDTQCDRHTIGDTIKRKGTNPTTDQAIGTVVKVTQPGHTRRQEAKERLQKEFVVVYPENLGNQIDIEVVLQRRANRWQFSNSNGNECKADTDSTKQHSAYIWFQEEVSRCCNVYGWNKTYFMCHES